MAVVFDAAAGVAGEEVNPSWSHTCAGADRVLLVAVSIRENATTVSGITYAGVALTFVRTDISVTRTEIWRLIAPAVGANTVAVTLVNPDVALTASISISVTGAHQTTPISNQAAATGTDTAPTVTVVSATNRLVVGFVMSRIGNTDAQITPGAGQTQRFSEAIVDEPRLEVTDELGAASVVTSWTLGTATDWIAQGIDLDVAGAPPAGPAAGLRTLTMTGVGL